MIRSTSTSGETLDGSPPARAIAERIAARSTTAGTPVKSCIRTRDGMKARSAVAEPCGHDASARTSSSETSRVPARRRRFSSRILTVCGSRSSSATAASRYSSTGPSPVSSRARAANGSLTPPCSQTPRRSSAIASRCAILVSRRIFASRWRRCSSSVSAIERRDRSRLALVVERDEHEVRAGGVGPGARLELLGFDADADLERGRPHVVHGRLHRHGVADVARGEERHLVHRDRDAHPAGVLVGGQTRRRVDELHDDAAVDDPRDVGVGDLHQLDERHLARRHPSGFEIVHVRDSRRRGAGSMPACVACSPSPWSSPLPVRPVRVRTSPPQHPPGRPHRRPRRRWRPPRRPRRRPHLRPRAPPRPLIRTSGSPKACRRSWTTPPTSR